MSKAKNTRISSWITKLQKRLMGLVDTTIHIHMQMVIHPVSSNKSPVYIFDQRLSLISYGEKRQKKSIDSVWTNGVIFASTYAK